MFTQAISKEVSGLQRQNVYKMIKFRHENQILRKIPYLHLFSSFAKNPKKWKGNWKQKTSTNVKFQSCHIPVVIASQSIYLSLAML